MISTPVVPGFASMIEKAELTKAYGGVNAVDRLSFVVLPGRVTGFLGPNGAGKVHDHAGARRAGAGDRRYGDHRRAPVCRPAAACAAGVAPANGTAMAARSTPSALPVVLTRDLSSVCPPGTKSPCFARCYSNT
jgi:hypothetical protein